MLRVASDLVPAGKHQAVLLLLVVMKRPSSRRIATKSDGAALGLLLQPAGKAGGSDATAAQQK